MYGRDQVVYHDGSCRQRCRIPIVQEVTLRVTKNEQPVLLDMNHVLNIIGLHQLEALRQDLINVIKQSTDPKWKIIMDGVLCCHSEAKDRNDGVTVTSRTLEMDDLMKQDKESNYFQHPGDSQIALSVHIPLYPPGRIVHIVHNHPKHSRWCCGREAPVYDAIWAENTDFNEVLISPTMVNDHMPDKVIEALEKVLSKTTATSKPPLTSAAKQNERTVGGGGGTASRTAIIDTRQSSPDTSDNGIQRSTVVRSTSLKYGSPENCRSFATPTTTILSIESECEQQSPIRHPSSKPAQSENIRANREPYTELTDRTTILVDLDPTASVKMRGIICERFSDISYPINGDTDEGEFKRPAHSEFTSLHENAADYLVTPTVAYTGYDLLGDEPIKNLSFPISASTHDYSARSDIKKPSTVAEDLLGSSQMRTVSDDGAVANLRLCEVANFTSISANTPHGHVSDMKSTSTSPDGFVNGDERVGYVRHSPTVDDDEDDAQCTGQQLYDDYIGHYSQAGRGYPHGVMRCQIHDKTVGRIVGCGLGAVRKQPTHLHEGDENENSSTSVEKTEKIDSVYVESGGLLDGNDKNMAIRKTSV